MQKARGLGIRVYEDQSFREMPLQHQKTTRRAFHQRRGYAGHLFQISFSSPAKGLGFRHADHVHANALNVREKLFSGFVFISHSQIPREEDV
jgi:hypothetical protein